MSSAEAEVVTAIVCDGGTFELQEVVLDALRYRVATRSLFGALKSS